MKTRPFERFDDQWWTVAYEVIAPVSVDIGNARLSVPVRAWQMEALLHCTLVSGGNRAKEVGCRIEEASLRAIVPGGIAIADGVLGDVADSLCPVGVSPVPARLRPPFPRGPPWPASNPESERRGESQDQPLWRLSTIETLREYSSP